MNVLRSVRFPWGEQPALSRTDWYVYQHARGASSAAGKFKARTTMGQAGRYEQPLWFLIDQ